MAARAFLRTARHPAAAAWPDATTFDHLYESGVTFDEVYAAMVEELVAAAAATPAGPVVYAVPGSPSVAERSVELLRADDRVEVTVVPALSFLDLAWNALGLDPLAAGVRLVDAAAFPAVAARERGPFLVAQAWSRHLLSDMKLGAARGRRGTRRGPVLLHHLGLDGRIGRGRSTGGTSTARSSRTISRRSTSAGGRTGRGAVTRWRAWPR